MNYRNKQLLKASSAHMYEYYFNRTSLLNSSLTREEYTKLLSFLCKIEQQANSFGTL